MFKYSDCLKLWQIAHGKIVHTRKAWVINTAAAVEAAEDMQATQLIPLKTLTAVLEAGAAVEAVGETAAAEDMEAVAMEAGEMIETAGAMAVAAAVDAAEVVEATEVTEETETEAEVTAAGVMIVAAAMEVDVMVVVALAEAVGAAGADLVAGEEAVDAAVALVVIAEADSAAVVEEDSTQPTKCNQKTRFSCRVCRATPMKTILASFLVQ